MAAFYKDREMSEVIVLPGTRGIFPSELFNNGSSAGDEFGRRSSDLGFIEVEKLVTWKRSAERGDALLKRMIDENIIGFDLSTGGFFWNDYRQNGSNGALECIFRNTESRHVICMGQSLLSPNLSHSFLYFWRIGGKISLWNFDEKKIDFNWNPSFPVVVGLKGSTSG